MAGRVTAMNLKMLVATLPADQNLAAWCRKLGISRPTAYKWRRRYAELGEDGLKDRSRAPRRPAGRVEAAMEDAVVAARKQLAEEGLDIGPASIAYRLATQGLTPPSEATIWRIALRRGQIVAQPAKRPRVSYRRFQRERPNECWQGDDTHYVLASGQEVRVINMIDDHSRLNVASLGAPLCLSTRVWEAFSAAAGRHGLPAEFLDDNGRAYVSPLGQTPVLFQDRLARLGVHQIRARPYHPQTCGKVERFHQTQRRWLNARPPAQTVAELQVLLDEFRVIYNEARPHRALGRRTPAEVWAAQAPAGPVAAADAPVLFAACQAQANGTINPARHLAIGLGVAWAGRHVTVLRRGNWAIVIDTFTGEIARELTIDPDRHYQPTGKPRGRRPKV